MAGLTASTHKELQIWIAGELKSFRAEVNGELKSLRSHVDGEFKAIRAELKGVESRLDTKIEGVEARLDARIVGVESKVEFVQWGVSIFVAPILIPLVIYFGKLAWGAARMKAKSMFDNGKGVPKDEVEAAKWCRKAAEQGDVDAQHNLGLMYAKGEGVLKDEVEAHVWFLLAKANRDEGDKSSSSHSALSSLLLAKENGDEGDSKVVSSLEERLTAEQKEKGQARAAELQRLIEQKSAE